MDDKLSVDELYAAIYYIPQIDEKIGSRFGRLVLPPRRRGHSLSEIPLIEVYSH